MSQLEFTVAKSCVGITDNLVKSRVSYHPGTPPWSNLGIHDTPRSPSMAKSQCFDACVRWFCLVSLLTRLLKMLMKCLGGEGLVTRNSQLDLDMICFWAVSRNIISSGTDTVRGNYHSPWCTIAWYTFLQNFINFYRFIQTFTTTTDPWVR